MSTYDTPTDLAAATLVQQSPTLGRLARERGWLDDDWVNLDAVVADLDALGHLSGAEGRLVRTVALLHQADLWGLDEANNTAAADAFQAAADKHRAAAEDARQAAARQRVWDAAPPASDEDKAGDER